MPVKIARSAPRPSFGLPELLVAIHTSRQSCCKAAKARIFTPVRESSGESRFNWLLISRRWPRTWNSGTDADEKQIMGWKMRRHQDIAGLT